MPAPEVLLVETLTIDEHPREVMVQRQCRQRAERDRAQPDHSQRAAARRQAGAALGAIHSIRVGGFYKRRPDGSWISPIGRSCSRRSINH